MPKLVVQTEINQDGIDKGLAKIEQKIAQFEQRTEGKQLSVAEQKEYDELFEEYNRLYAKQGDILKAKTEQVQLEREITSETVEQTSQVNQWVNGVMTLSDGTRLVKKNEQDINEETKEHIANIDKLGTGLKNVIKKVTKWGLAIIGVRSAYSAIRRAMSLVQSNNEKIANTFKVMGVAVANALTPFVEKLVNIIKTIMLYIDYIYFRLTSRHLFDFSKAFADANKNAQGTANAVNKMTTSFDEMNVVQDNSSSGGGVGGMSENPFEGWENFKPPKWLETIGDIIKKLADIVKKYWKGIVVALIVAGITLLALKFAKFIKGLKGTGDAVGGIGTSFTGFFDSLGKGIEAIAILGGLALVIKAITDLITAFSESGLKLTDVIGLMATILVTLIALITALTIAGNALQSPMAMAGVLVLMVAIAGILYTIKETLPTILDAVAEFIKTTAPSLNMILETIGKNIELIIVALGNTLPPIIKSVGKMFEKIFTGISNVIRTVGDVIIDIMTTARDSVGIVLGAVLNFINELGPAINRFVDNAIIAVTKLINFMVSGIEYLVNTLVIDALRGMIKGINKMIPGEALDIKLPNYVSIQRFRPRLAKGGIINMPGRGVPVGNAIGGEKAPEGVIPLTDSQQMALLGEAIGKYININATVPVYVGNRMVAREIKRINAEDNFAYNR